MRKARIEPSLTVVQSLRVKPAYRTSEFYELTGSKATAHRIIGRLVELGFAERLSRGYLSIRSSVYQPGFVWPHLIPSLHSFKRARYFGRAYDESDVRWAMGALRGIVTLDYRAYELTRFQTPGTYYLYVDDIEVVARELGEKKFSEGRMGRIAIMPKFGSFDNEVQRVYLDCLAMGGRSLLDAIAIELLYSDRLAVRGEFPSESVAKVMEDLPRGPR